MEGEGGRYHIPVRADRTDRKPVIRAGWMETSVDVDAPPISLDLETSVDIDAQPISLGLETPVDMDGQPLSPGWRNI